MATLGTRIFGADELFLLCSFALGWRAAFGQAVLPLGSSAAFWPFVQYGWVGAISFLALLTVRRKRLVLGLACFGTLCAFAPSTWAPAVVYTPTLGFLLLTNALHPKKKQKSSSD